MRKLTRFVLFVVAGLLCFESLAVERESDYYRLETFTLPTGLKLEVSGMARLPTGEIALAIRKGEVWLVDNVEDPKNARFRRFASGLHEPLGLAFYDGDLYTVQRTELTRLRDTNRDGRADGYKTIARGWGVTGNYHEYAYGPVFDSRGNAWLTLNCSIGKGTRPADNHWRGWSMRASLDGRLEPVSGGFRSPSGLGIDLNDAVFATDQQGNWFPTCCLIHVRPGVFHGHADALAFLSLPGATFTVEGALPKNLTVVEAAQSIEAYELPAVWFPYRKMGMSATDVLCDTTEGKFGPFSGQLFVGEFTQSFVSRVYLEKVKGRYQGVCFRFREGLQSAVLRLGWTAEGALLVGQTNRGWNSLGSRSFGLQKISPTGELPFEIQRMEALSDGFRLTFTTPVEASSALNLQNYSMISYTYPYHSSYGGNEINMKRLEIEAVRLEEGGQSIELELMGLRRGYVHELDLSGLVSAEGKPLLHPLAYYTLNQIPDKSGKP